MVYDDNLTVAGALQEGIRLSIACNEPELRRLMQVYSITAMHFTKKDSFRDEDAHLSGVVVLKTGMQFDRMEGSLKEKITAIAAAIKANTRYDFRVEQSPAKNSSVLETYF